MNFPPQFQGQFPPGAGPSGGPGVPGVPQVPGGGVQVMSEHQRIALMQQQGYLAQQQQQLAAMAASGGQIPPGMMVRPGMIPPHMQPSGPGKSKKKSRNSHANPAAQLLPRHMGGPPSNDQYVKAAMMAPQAPGVPPVPGMPAPNAAEIEPWADVLDELDPRELAMGRFRTRHEIMAEVFGPDTTRDVPVGPTDPWEGLGINGESLEAKVLALEKSNDELEAKFEADLEAWKKRLEDAGGHDVSVSA